MPVRLAGRAAAGRGGDQVPAVGEELQQHAVREAGDLSPARPGCAAAPLVRARRALSPGETNAVRCALGGDNVAGTSYANWVAGYGTTTAIAVTTAENFGGGQATASISATQSDGSVRDYSGTYSVQDGVIVSAQITQQ